MTWSLRGLRWSFCAYIGLSSLQTFAGAWSSHDVHALILAGVEVIAIVAFLFDGLVRPACIGLVLVFTIAGLITVAQGQSPLRFLYFAATSVYVTLARRTMKLRPVDGRTAPVSAS